MYADDAAIPADSASDLQLAAAIFEEFCNSHHLFISIPKTYVTVFHAPDDLDVRYENNQVWVDGGVVEISIYGRLISAAQSFKYLGV
eukprot:4549803-Karenia_brevis.AAC.1